MMIMLAALPCFLGAGNYSEGNNKGNRRYEENTVYQWQSEQGREHRGISKAPVGRTGVRNSCVMWLSDQFLWAKSKWRPTGWDCRQNERCRCGRNRIASLLAQHLCVRANCDGTFLWLSGRRRFSWKTTVLHLSGSRSNQKNAWGRRIQYEPFRRDVRILLRRDGNRQGRGETAACKTVKGLPGKMYCNRQT